MWTQIYLLLCCILRLINSLLILSLASVILALSSPLPWYFEHLNPCSWGFLLSQSLYLCCIQLFKKYSVTAIAYFRTRCDPPFLQSFLNTLDLWIISPLNFTIIDFTSGSVLLCAFCFWAQFILPYYWLTHSNSFLKAKSESHRMFDTLVFQLLVAYNMEVIKCSSPLCIQRDKQIKYIADVAWKEVEFK